MSIWVKGLLVVLVVWAVGVSVFLAVNTLHARDQDHRLWCLEVGETTLQIGVGRVAGTLNDNVEALQGWSILQRSEFAPPGVSPYALPPSDRLVLSDDEGLASKERDVLRVCETQNELGP